MLSTLQEVSPSRRSGYTSQLSKCSLWGNINPRLGRNPRATFPFRSRQVELQANQDGNLLPRLGIPDPWRRPASRRDGVVRGSQRKGCGVTTWLVLPKGPGLYHPCPPSGCSPAFPSKTRHLPLVKNNLGEILPLSLENRDICHGSATPHANRSLRQMSRFG